MIPARFARGRMSALIEGTDRGQSTLFPECLGDWISKDNPFRVIDVFVGELDPWRTWRSRSAMSACKTPRNGRANFLTAAEAYRCLRTRGTTTTSTDSLSGP